ncbi:hypothetical protein BO70DRAFT_364816 [Aspergillus heteromorphus CBS 117.55]|uniref:Uncharacterized protein n=1 Tax=Aspergillus heteromorphus CBS 117.55 TaxID=1448321 RepID=A0A317VFQ7_9EURO|nr:uncharacterized protein BO70DRAFT_364816 [Aspergillus heteromorphus CBS 117.55]PWY72269.1 hypothetical protein BO70DRAFT_364816 [Aspergillus heteromorphus CBS 117.55]
MSSEPRKQSGQYHLTGSQIVESIDDLGSEGRWGELNQRAQQQSATGGGTGTTSSTTHRTQAAQAKAHSFRPYTGSLSTLPLILTMRN